MSKYAIENVEKAATCQHEHGVNFWHEVDSLEAACPDPDCDNACVPKFYVAATAYEALLEVATELAEAAEDALFHGDLSGTGPIEGEVRATIAKFNRGIPSVPNELLEAAQTVIDNRKDRG